MRNPSLDQMQERTQSLAVPCPDCRQPENGACGYRDRAGTWRELEAFPAHINRTKAARAKRENA